MHVCIFISMWASTYRSEKLLFFLILVTEFIKFKCIFKFTLGVSFLLSTSDMLNVFTFNYQCVNTRLKFSISNISLQILKACGCACTFVWVFSVKHRVLKSLKPHLFCLDRCVFIATNISPCSAAYKYFPTDIIKPVVKNQQMKHMAFTWLSSGSC